MIVEHPYIEEISKIADFVELSKNVGVIPCIPILGGVFTGRQYWMGSKSTRASNGLHSVTYYVIEKSTGLIIGLAGTKSESLSQARELLMSMTRAHMDRVIMRLSAELESREKCRRATELDTPPKRQSPKSEQPRIPARRRRIFEKSNGKCHYCGCSLELTGKWHVEHKMPKALGGDSSPGNLVAACVPCNQRKRDRTDQEFISGIPAIEGDICRGLV